MAKLIVNGYECGGSSDNATSISCLDKDGNETTVQAELDSIINDCLTLNEIISRKPFLTRGLCGDANTINENGVYRLSAGSTNTNGNTNGLLISFVLDNDVSFQWIMRYDGLFQYMRINWYGNWYPWKRNITEENFSYSNGTLNITV